MKKLKLLVICLLLCFGCNTTKAPSPFRQKFEECLNIIGNEFSDGTAIVGETDGKASLYIYRNVTDEIDEWRIRVGYKVFIPIVSKVSDQYDEDGGLSNFRLEQGKFFGAKQLSADWSPKGSGSGKFSISIIKNRNSEYVVYVGILGSSWNYFDNVKLDKSSLDKLIVLLEGSPLATQQSENESHSNTSSSDSNPNNGSNEVTSTQEVYQEDDIIDEFICTIDFLRLREDSTINSKILEYVRVNEVLDNLHNTSHHSDTITLNGVTTVAPWYHVKSKKGNVGWVNGCCVELAK